MITGIQNKIEVDDLVNEYDFTTERRMLFDIQGETLKKNFLQRNVEVHIMNDRVEVFTFIQKFIEEREDIREIAFSDGATLYQLGLFDWVNNNYSGRQAVGGGQLFN